jgi:dTDP-4-dehydrorhamnose reductase
MTTVLLTGAAGCLGQHLLRRRPSGMHITALWRRTPTAWTPAVQLDLADGAAVAALVRRLRPDLVIHTAYATADLERDVVQATRNLCDAVAAAGARLIHLSTDALLDGEHAPYAETAEPAPVHAYGRAKAAAERYVRQVCPAAAVVRSSLILGLEPLNASSGWIVERLRAGQEVDLFVDELRCPIAAADLADQVWEIAALPVAEAAGVWHLAGPEALSRFSLGLLLARRFGLDASRLRPALCAAGAGPRPRDLRLTTARADAALRTRPRPAAQGLSLDA